MTYALLNLADGSHITADTISELVDQTIPEHGAVPDGPNEASARLLIRQEFLADAAARAQSLILAQLTDQYPDQVAALDEDVFAVLHHDRHTDVIEFTEWDSNIPLFLMTTGYAPYTELPRPAGETIVFLDPSDERTFVDSLVAVGMVELLVRDDKTAT